jgi:exo-beta-1,3-glucanase (GH17 family)
MPEPTPKPALRYFWLLFCVAVAALVTAAGWWLPNHPVQVGSDPNGPRLGVIESVSFAPFRRGQSPLTRVYPTPEQVIEDLESLKGIAGGIRTYTAREGLEGVPPEAQRLGLTVMQGVWLGADRSINEKEVQAAIELANRYPAAIKSLVVGNEVLLRKDLPVDELIGYIRRIRAAVKQPVTYADVWEFWLRFPQLLNEVDFVTVHFLPYWEDMPIAASQSMPHIMDVYRTVQAKLPGKPIVIGEVGWPSEGRSRREAVPSRTEAAGFIADFMRLAEKEKLSYNLVEAFDQPWKVKLEGTVGGAWGVLDELRRPKFEAGGLVSNLPEWPLFAGLSILIALILLVLHAHALVKLPPAAMVVTVFFVQGLSAMLAAAIERGLEYNFSWVHMTEAAILVAMLGLFAVLLLRELLDRLRDVSPAVLPLQPLGDRLRELRHPFAALKLAPARQRLGEWVYGLLALWMVYHGLMLVVAGRYRDFPLDYFLLPLAGLLLLRLLVLWLGRPATDSGLAQFALAAGFADVGRKPGDVKLGCEAGLVFLLLSLPVLGLLLEKPDNREAVYWCLLTAGYALPLLGNLALALRRRHDHNAAPAESSAAAA